MDDYTSIIQERLFELQDEQYGDFQSKLIPSVNRESIIGVRTPELRRLAKELSGTDEALYFLSALPHKYFDENNLHGFLIERIRDFDACIAATEAFLPYVDSWATCDLMSPKIYKKHLPELLAYIRRWIKSESVYTVRFGIGMLMSHYLDENFVPEYVAIVSGVQSEEYYIKMMVAWYFATALAKQYDTAIAYIEEKRLDVWTHNKTIQKAVESYRIPQDRKNYLRSLRIK